MSVRRFVVTAAALGALTLSGCSGESTSAEPEPSPSSASPSASSTEPALAQEVMAEPPQRPDDKKTVAGAEAFGAYVVEALWYGVQQRDLSLLWSLVDKPATCSSCRSIENGLEDDKREGRWQVLTEPITVRDSSVLDRSNWVVGVAFKQPRIKQYDEQGEQTDTFKPVEEFIEMGLEWHGGRWTLYNFRYAED